MKLTAHLFRIVLLLATLLGLASPAKAQREPHIAYIYPAGGKQGTTFEAIIGGRYLENTTNVFITGAGITAKITDAPEILPSKKHDEMLKKIDDLQEKRKSGIRVTPEEMKEAEVIRKRLAEFNRKRINPALADFVSMQVTIASNAVPGNREIRLATPLGLSNLRTFEVGQLPEYSKEHWKSAPPRPDKMDNMDIKREDPTLTKIVLPATVNGQMPPAGIDRYQFTARKGQRIVAIVEARSLIPYLADAVPGWFQATLTLYDSNENIVMYADDYRFNPDPVLFYEIPKDGDYTLAVKDSLYRGREDFVYRITLGEVPFVTSVYPLGGRAGTSVSYELRGWNMPVPGGNMNLAKAAPGVYPMAVRNRGVTSNHIPFAVDTLPEVFEGEPNNTITNAQPVRLPVIINGRINQPGDADVFFFNGTAGDEIVAEVMARRLGSPLDSILKLTDTNGKQLASNDDHEDKGSGLDTHHADSYIRFTLPTTGRYYLHIGDTQQKGGAPYTYRLRVSAPRPDFALRVTPSSVTLRGPMSAPLTVFALRRDGFTNDVKIALKDAPEGFKLTGGVIPAGQDQAMVTLSVYNALSTKEPRSLHLEGRATVAGREVIHEALPAEDLMQAFAYRHLVPSQDLKVMLVGGQKGGNPPPIKILSQTPVKIPVGGTATVLASIPGEFFSRIGELELIGAPEGISIKSTTGKERQTEIVLQADVSKVTPGQKGSLIVNIPPKKDNGKRKPPPLGTLPAIPFVIVGK